MNVGQTIGPYQILAKLGEGGMGEVWRARDTKLGREIAIKTLPAEFAHDSDRRGRFEQEARALAALNHANVGAIYGLEERDGIAFLVLELVEGATLADEIAKGPLPVERSRAIAAQIAEGLEAAHEAGIIHRDLKPANIKLARSGGSLDPPSVKILDFGLARTLGPSTGGPEMLKSTAIAATMPGVILGTVAYMSPEQARGEVVDKRSDIFAFGCVLYECLTGQQAFGGATMTDALAATVKSDPDWSRLPATLPESVRDLLRRCLQKNPRQRLQSIGDARVILQEPIAPLRMPTPEAAAPAPWRFNRGTAAAALAVGVLGGVAIGRFAWPRDSQPPSPPATVRAVFALPSAMSINLGAFPSLALSPDGRTIVFRANQGGALRLFRRTLDGVDPQPIAGTEGGYDPFFSPDGQSLGFFAQARLKKVALAGGAPSIVCEVPLVAVGAAWLADESIVFARGPNYALSRVSASGGAVEDWSHLDAARGEHAHTWPQVLPGGRMLVTMVFGRDFQDLDDSRAVILSPGEKPRDLMENSAFARIVPGWLIFLRGQDLLAAPFDNDRLEVTGPPVPVREPISISPGRRVPHFVVSSDGTLLFGTGSPLTPTVSDLVRVDRTGKVTPFPVEAASYFSVRLSPDGKRLVMSRLDGMSLRLFVFDIERSILSPLTPEPGRFFTPVWSPDSRRVASTRFEDTEPRLYMRNVDGSDAGAMLTDTPQDAEFPNSWSPDGKLLAYTRTYTADRSTTRKRGTSDIWLAPVERRAVPYPWFETPFHEIAATFSPDGRFIAYVSDESGQQEVYVRPFPGPGGKIQVSNQGGTEPTWASNGQEILYRDKDRFMSVAFRATPEATTSAPRLLFSGSFDSSSREDVPRAYDVARDGSYLVAMQTRKREPIITQLAILTNWTKSLGTRREQ